jgi:hypothetical protein
MRNYATKVYNYVDKKTGVHIVKAVTIYAGRYVEAIAKCDPTDTFDLEFGTKIALTRLDLKIAKKRQVSMKAWANASKEYLEYLKAQERKARKANEYAEVAVLDRKVEIKKLEAALAEMLKEA